MKLVLFDIDGTLLWTDGAGRRAIHRALVETFGSTGPQDYRFDGKTDPQIVRDLMRQAGHGDAHIDAKMDALFERYLLYLREELRTPGHHTKVMPGVPQLLDLLEARADVVLGLLTGNLREGAAAKLAAVGIDPSRFRIGAFGSDHEHRPELPGIARSRTFEMLGIDVRGPAIVVIGDTPADLTCGLALGARAIGVATGRYSMEELAQHRPHAVFSDLSDARAVLEAIVSE